jgi:hypothetical protein
MPTTTKMGIVYPSSTDLVKDGATAMGTISTTVDSKTGLVLLNTTSFSAVASQSVNSVFTSSFTNYKLLVNATEAGGSNQMFLRLRASGTDVSTGYFWAGSYVPTSGAGTVTGFNGSGDTTWFRIGGATDSNERTISVIELFNPQASATTAYTSLSIDGNNFGAIYHSGLLNNTNAYDGFTLHAQTSTISGTVQIFGYNQ